jgi:DNA-binding FadR family transcriptional regulator
MSVIDKIDSEFLRYLLSNGGDPGSRLSSLSEISAETGLSVGKLREQLEVARALGLVEASPRRGITAQAYSFLPAVRLSMMVALAMDSDAFSAFSALRVHLEESFWPEAVVLLTDGDKAHLQDLVTRAWEKLNHDRIQIPHAEHRDFHLTIFCRLGNPFVTGLLQAYWEGYEAVQLSNYADLSYLQAVWRYHERIANSIVSGDVDGGRRLLVEHSNLIGRMGVVRRRQARIPVSQGEEA